MLNDRIFDNDEILIDPPLSQQEQHVLVNKRLDWARSVETATRYECADLEERHHHALLDARIAQSFKRRLQVEQTAWVSSMLAKHAMIANRESMANMSLQERSFTLATAISRDTGSSKFSATACSFLTLPTEIRIKIYEALFAGRHINVFEHEEYHESAICESAAKRHFCQILLTCKKFCLEGTPVMYSTATWIVPWTPHFQHTLLTRSSTVSLELIRKIVFNYNPFQSEELTPRGFHNIRARRWATYQQQHLRRFPYQLFPNLESLILDCTEKELKFDSREQIDSIRSFENMFQAYYNGGDWRDPSNETPDYGGHCADEVKSAIPENRKFEISLLVLWSDSVKIPDNDGEWVKFSYSPYRLHLTNRWTDLRMSRNVELFLVNLDKCTFTGGYLGPSGYRYSRASIRADRNAKDAEATRDLPEEWNWCENYNRRQ